MKRILFFVLLFLLSALSPAVAASQFIDARLYMTDASTLTLSWDAQPAENGIPDYYDIVATCIETGQEWGHRTNETSIVIQKPRVGHFKFGVRACKEPVGDELLNCTVFSESVGAGAAIWVDGVFVRNDSWIVFWRLSPPIFE